MKPRRLTRKRNIKRKRKTARVSPAYSPVSPQPSYVYSDVNEAVYAFYEMTKNYTYEICATIQDNGPAGVYLVLHNTHKMGEGRNMCVYKYYDRIILHNHPDKYYPSREDIEKIVKVKNKIIQESYITSKIGIWKLVVHPDKKLTQTVLDQKYDAIKSVLTTFYSNTEKGRQYNETAVSQLCEDIQNIYGIIVTFTPV